MKILRDFKIRTDHRIPARRQDIVVLDKETKTVQTIEVAVPANGNINEKELESRTTFLKKHIQAVKIDTPTPMTRPTW